MRVTSSLAVEERRQDMAARLSRDGTLALADEARRFGVHEMTIRRDFEHLESVGLVRRVRGGAVVTEADAFDLRMRRAQRAKRAIAQKLIPLAPMTGAIAIDASTTLVHFARLVRGSDLSAVTNGWATFDELRRRPGVRPFLTGGESEELNASLVGSLALRSVEGFHFSTAFLSTTSISPDRGTSEPTLPQVDVKKAMVAVADRVVLAVDSSKLATTSAIRGLAFSDIDVMVTELDPCDARLDPYRGAIDLL